MLNEVDSLKVARYLVEDNDEKFVEFSLLAEGSIPRVRSILKNLIGNYVLMEVSRLINLEIWGRLNIKWNWNCFN